MIKQNTFYCSSEILSIQANIVTVADKKLAPFGW